MNARLITDHDEDKAILAHALRLAGVEPLIDLTLEGVLESWSEQPGDLIVIALQSTECLAIVQAVRQTVIVPLILIVDAMSEDAVIRLIDGGADWVFQRPFSLRMFIAYTRSLLRRSGNVGRATLPSIRFEAVRLNPANRTVTVGAGKPKRLSQLEFRLLHALMLHQGQVLPTNTIVEHVWGYTGDGDRGLVRGLVNRLRSKIEPHPEAPSYIQTIPRVGYLFGAEEG